VVADSDPARDPVPPISLPPLPGLGAPPWARAVTWWQRLDPGARPLVVGVAAVACVALAAGGWWVSRPAPAPPEIALPSAAAPAAAERIEMVVHAAGAVMRPGVYRVADGARVADLIDAAGGPTPDADLDRLNLAAGVRDGEQIYVPRIGEPGTAAPGSAAADDGIVDLNTATSVELESLPGIGPATARAILDWREQHGPFTSVDQLLEVRGIGDAKLAAIRDQVRV
jgi:competence protein ComEA